MISQYFMRAGLCLFCSPHGNDKVIYPDKKDGQGMITRDKIVAAVCITATAAGLLFITLKVAGWLAGPYDSVAVVLDFFAILFCAWVLSWWMRR